MKEVAAAIATLTPAQAVANAAGQTVSLTVGGDTVSLEGRVRNLGPKTAYQLKLVVSELDGKGKVALTRSGMLDETALEAGQDEGAYGY